MHKYFFVVEKETRLCGEEEKNGHCTQRQTERHAMDRRCAGLLLMLMKGSFTRNHGHVRVAVPFANSGICLSRGRAERGR